MVFRFNSPERESSGSRSRSTPRLDNPSRVRRMGRLGEDSFPIPAASSKTKRAADLELIREPGLAVLVLPRSSEILEDEIDAQDGRPGEVRRPPVRLIERVGGLDLEVADVHEPIGPARAQSLLPPVLEANIGGEDRERLERSSFRIVDRVLAPEGPEVCDVAIPVPPFTAKVKLSRPSATS